MNFSALSKIYLSKGLNQSDLMRVHLGRTKKNNLFKLKVPLDVDSVTQFTDATFYERIEIYTSPGMVVDVWKLPFKGIYVDSDGIEHPEYGSDILVACVVDSSNKWMMFIGDTTDSTPENWPLLMLYIKMGQEERIPGSIKIVKAKRGDSMNWFLKNTESDVRENSSQIVWERKSAEWIRQNELYSINIPVDFSKVPTYFADATFYSNVSLSFWDNLSQGGAHEDFIFDVWKLPFKGIFVDPDGIEYSEPGSDIIIAQLKNYGDNWAIFIGDASALEPVEWNLQIYYNKSGSQEGCISGWIKILYDAHGDSVDWFRENTTQF